MSDEDNNIMVEKVGEDNGDVIKDDSDKEVEAIRLSCQHINKFVEELSKCDTKAMSVAAKQQILDSKKHIQKLLEIQKELSDENRNDGIKRSEEEKLADTLDKIFSNHKTNTEKSQDVKKRPKQELFQSSGSEINDDSDSSDDQKRKSNDKKRKNNDIAKQNLSENKNADMSILEILAEKIDNRKVPLQGNYDENTGESLKDYLTRFESYCQDNLRGGRSFWIDELERRFTGDTLKAFQAIRDIGDSYDHLKEKLIAWYDNMKGMRKKKAKSQFDKAKYNSHESLYLYSTRLEKLFRRAFPHSKIEKSRTLREKFIDTIPYTAKKRFTEQMFQDRLNEKSTKWSDVQKYARCRDVWKEEIKSDDSNDESKETKEIVINVGELSEKSPPKKNKEIEVQYDENQKRFYISNPGLVNLRPPQVQFSHEFKGNTSNQPKKDFYYPRNFQNNNYRQNNPSYRYGERKPYNQGNNFSAPPNVNVKHCYRCGKMGHFISQCNAKMPTCYVCGIPGHISRNCRKRQEGRSNSVPPRYGRRFNDGKEDKKEDAGKVDYKNDETNANNSYRNNSYNRMNRNNSYDQSRDSRRNLNWQAL